ncbi:MAG: hypothetical protein M3Z66_11520 [Chloroflexota bacterium]|nr:hypothetical protein [Chloroflexota bacterium]
MGEEPEDEVRRVVPGKGVPDQQLPQRREILRQGDADGGPLLPTFPAAPGLPGWEHGRAVAVAAAAATTIGDL